MKIDYYLFNKKEIKNFHRLVGEILCRKETSSKTEVVKTPDYLRNILPPTRIPMYEIYYHLLENLCTKYTTNY